jgi:hypothetical protein
MAAVPPALNPIVPPSEAPASVTKIEALGVKLEIPLPKWAVAVLAVLLLIAAAGAGAYWSVTRIGKTVLIPAAQAEVYEETNFHLSEPDELKEAKKELFNGLTTVTINYFKSDGCVQIVRWDAVANKGDGLWMFGAHPHTVGHNHETASLPNASEAPSTQPAARNLRSVSYKPLIDEGIDLGDDHLHPVQGGQCWNPHPGAFTVFNQQVNQCLVQVWRTFYDGCVHYQFFNPCTGTWDVYPNGAPHVVWTRCIH